MENIVKGKKQGSFCGIVFAIDASFKVSENIKGSWSSLKCGKMDFSCLNVRRQHVVINGKSSSWGNAISGVPQGSVIELVLFLFYINDIDIDLCLKLCKFADDIKNWSCSSNRT